MSVGDWLIERVVAPASVDDSVVTTDAKGLVEVRVGVDLMADFRRFPDVVTQIQRDLIEFSHLLRERLHSVASDFACLRPLTRVASASGVLLRWTVTGSLYCYGLTHQSLICCLNMVLSLSHCCVLDIGSVRQLCVLQVYFPGCQCQTSSGYVASSSLMYDCADEKDFSKMSCGTCRVGWHEEMGLRRFVDGVSISVQLHDEKVVQCIVAADASIPNVHDTLDLVVMPLMARTGGLILYVQGMHIRETTFKVKLPSEVMAPCKPNGWASPPERLWMFVERLNRLTLRHTEPWITLALFGVVLFSLAPNVETGAPRLESKWNRHLPSDSGQPLASNAEPPASRLVVALLTDDIRALDLLMGHLANMLPIAMTNVHMAEHERLPVLYIALSIVPPAQQQALCRTLQTRSVFLGIEATSTSPDFRKRFPVLSPFIQATLTVFRRDSGSALPEALALCPPRAVAMATFDYVSRFLRVMGEWDEEATEILDNFVNLCERPPQAEPLIIILAAFIHTLSSNTDKIDNISIQAAVVVIGKLFEFITKSPIRTAEEFAFALERVEEISKLRDAR
ncbi:MAG: hypothetical protein KVP17_000170 [Porospora cf. gigantea B]|uniref:uncharacterized protein n=1 Tax=Porospora cf. gigantea B TaxID=2853592 RepID=UPI00357188D5|nr:MAG: hypothetical protein KVP17_000170 [Porospora cf. gigantea B]